MRTRRCESQRTSQSVLRVSRKKSTLLNNQMFLCASLNYKPLFKNFLQGAVVFQARLNDFTSTLLSELLSRDSSRWRPARGPGASPACPACSLRDGPGLCSSDARRSARRVPVKPAATTRVPGYLGPGNPQGPPSPVQRQTTHGDGLRNLENYAKKLPREPCLLSLFISAFFLKKVSGKVH